MLAFTALDTGVQDIARPRNRAPTAGIKTLSALKQRKTLTKPNHEYKCSKHYNSELFVNNM
jgi:hypothetical protein